MLFFEVFIRELRSVNAFTFSKETNHQLDLSHKNRVSLPEGLAIKSVHDSSTSGSISVGEITALNHELLYNSVKFASFVSEAFLKNENNKNQM